MDHFSDAIYLLLVPLYWRCIQKFKVPSKLEPRPASRADVAPDLPANKANEPHHANMGTEKRGSDQGGNRGSRGTAPDKHTHQKTHESRQHTRRAASFTAFLLPLLIPQRLYSQGWLCRSADVLCAVDVHVSINVDVDGQSTGSDLHNHRQ